MKKLLKNIKVLFAAALLLTAVAAKAQTTVATTVTEKKVAILPMSFATDGSPVRIEEMRYRLQNLAFIYLKEKAVELKFQDPAETNALLLKNGIREANFREFTPKEIANILGVEYYLGAIVIQERTATSTQRHSQKEDDWEGRGKQEQSRTTQEMNTTIDMNIYNSSGENIYTKSRRSILSDADAYKPCLEYLLKRSPLYKR